MFKPASRTLAMSAWKAGSVARTDARVAKIRHEGFEVVEPGFERCVLVAVELHEEKGVGFADQHAVDRGAIDRYGAAEVDHGAVHQLHRLGVEGHDMLRGLHSGAEGGELADAEDLTRLDRVQGELDGGGEREGAFGADEQAGEIFPIGGAGGRGQHIDVVPADSTELTGEARGDFVSVFRTEVAEAFDQVENRQRNVRADIMRDRPEAMTGAIGQDGLDCAHVVSHQAVADGLGATGVVAGHTADSATRVRRGIDREKQPMGLQDRIEVREHEARLDQGGACLRVDVENVAKVFGAVDNDGAVDGLAALTGAAAARQHGNTGFAGDGKRGGDIVDGFGHDHADGFDLVNRGVGGIAAAVGRTEQDLPGDFALEHAGDGRIAWGG